jgi:hypothetical protein
VARSLGDSTGLRVLDISDALENDVLGGVGFAVAPPVEAALKLCKRPGASGLTALRFVIEMLERGEYRADDIALTTTEFLRSCLPSYVSGDVAAPGVCVCVVEVTCRQCGVHAPAVGDCFLHCTCRPSARCLSLCPDLKLEEPSFACPSKCFLHTSQLFATLHPDISSARAGKVHLLGVKDQPSIEQVLAHLGNAEFVPRTPVAASVAFEVRWRLMVFF